MFFKRVSHGFERRARLLKATFRSDISSKDISPTFIVSAGRSGSTFLRKTLLGSRQINIPPETGQIIPNAMTRFLKARILFEKRDGVIKSFQESSDFKFWDLQDKNMMRIMEEGNIQSLSKMIEVFYREYALKFNFNAEVWGDKTPYLTYFVPELKAIFPNAKFIHLIRNPIDVIRSRMTYFEEDIYVATNRWISSVKAIRNQRINNLIEVRYEDLLLDEDQNFQKIFDFVGIGKFRAEFKNADVHLGDDSLDHHRRLVDGKIHKKIELSDDDRRYLEKQTKVLRRIYNY